MHGWRDWVIAAGIAFWVIATPLAIISLIRKGRKK